jgi:hypothetical protein
MQSKFPESQLAPMPPNTAEFDHDDYKVQGYKTPWHPTLGFRLALMPRLQHGDHPQIHGTLHQPIDRL